MKKSEPLLGLCGRSNEKEEKNEDKYCGGEKESTWKQDG
jgi:hypothetical protein